MRPKSMILLVLALGCGLVASIGINQVMANRDQAPPPMVGETEPIFVALTDVSMGEKLTQANVKLEAWPKDKVPNGALTALEDVEGRLTRTRLYAGEPILEAKLLSKDASGMGAAPLIPKGYRVVALPMNSVASGGGLILPGNRVDVLVHVKADPNRGIPETGTWTVLQDVQVFAVNDMFTRDPRDRDEASIQAKTISLLLTPEQSQLVFLANEIGTIRLTMRSHEDEDVADIAATPINTLFGKGDKADRDKETLLDEEPKDDASNLLSLIEETPEPEEPAEKPWIMLVLRGESAEEVQFEKGHIPERGRRYDPSGMDVDPAAAGYLDPSHAGAYGAGPGLPLDANGQPVRLPPPAVDGPDDGALGIPPSGSRGQLPTELTPDMSFEDFLDKMEKGAGSAPR